MPPQDKSDDTEIEAHSEAGKKAHRAGNFKEAIEHQLKVINHESVTIESHPDEFKLLSLYFYGLKDYAAAAQVLKLLKESYPDDPDAFENFGVVLRKLKRLPEAVVELERAVEMNPEKANAHDALAHSYGVLKEAAKCKKHGRISLELKSRDSIKRGIRHPVPEEPPLKFSYGGNNVIAFSLWGEDPRYLNGALRNARLLPDIYPGWKGRIYHDDSVPRLTLDKLKDTGMEMVKMARPKAFFDGLFWRFLPATDDAVDRFLIRDIDSVVNVKERVAVDEWLDSDKYFHVMRDYFSHSELILAGMWGGVGGVLPSLEQLRSEFNPGIRATDTYDQLFLRLAVWPTISQSLLSHDSVFQGLNSVPFPKYGKLPPGKHVGQNESALETRD